MTRYFEEFRRVLERHGGTVEKFIGDAVMAVFGLPRLHEDDALRAVRAAYDMKSALARLNQEVEGLVKPFPRLRLPQTRRYAAVPEWGHRVPERVLRFGSR